MGLTWKLGVAKGFEEEMGVDWFDDTMNCES